MTDRYEDYQELMIERKGNGILLITMNRPEVLNVTTYSMHAELARIWDDVDRDHTIKVAVITGAGQAFCSGNDPNNPVPDHDMVREILADALARGWTGPLSLEPHLSHSPAVIATHVHGHENWALKDLSPAESFQVGAEASRRLLDDIGAAYG